MPRPVLLALGMLLAPASVWSAELRFGYPQTPAGAVAVVAHELRTWDRHNLTVQALPFPAAINTRDAIVGGKLEVGIAGLANFIAGAAAADTMAIRVAFLGGVRGIREGEGRPDAQGRLPQLQSRLVPGPAHKHDQAMTGSGPGGGSRAIVGFPGG